MTWAFCDFMPYLDNEALQRVSNFFYQCNSMGGAVIRKKQ
jgi:hypothetical protein